MASLNDDIDEDIVSEDGKVPADFAPLDSDVTSKTAGQPESPPVTFVVTDQPIRAEDSPTAKDLFGDVLTPGKLPNLEIKTVFTEEDSNKLADAQSVFSSIKGFGAISRSDIAAFESFVPGTLETAKAPLEFYTATPTKTMYDKSIAVMSSQLSNLSTLHIASCISSLKAIDAATAKTKEWIGEVNLHRGELKQDHVQNILDLIDKNPMAATAKVDGFDKTVKEILDGGYLSLGLVTGKNDATTWAATAHALFVNRGVSFISQAFCNGVVVTESDLVGFQRMHLVEEDGNMSVRKMLSFTASESERDMFNGIVGLLEDISTAIGEKIKVLEESTTMKESELSSIQQDMDLMKSNVIRLTSLATKMIQFEHANVSLAVSLLNVLYRAVETGG